MTAAVTGRSARRQLRALAGLDPARTPADNPHRPKSPAYGLWDEWFRAARRERPPAVPAKL